jgi:hypothetical protein
VVCYQRSGCPDIGVRTSRFYSPWHFIKLRAFVESFLSYKDVSGGFEVSLLESATLPSRYDVSTLALRR